MLYGDKNALKTPENLVLSDIVAYKLFGDVMPVGKSFTIQFENNVKKSFTVGAVIDIPENSSLEFSILIPFNIQKTIFQDYRENDWEKFTNATFIVLDPSSNQNELFRNLASQIQLQNEVNQNTKIKDFSILNLTQLSKQSYDIRQSIAFSQNPIGLIAMGIISLFLLIIASFNYLNLSISSSSARLKEIGLRKTVGGKRGELIFQFITENIVLCVFAVLLGLFIAKFVLWPGFIHLIPRNYSFSFSSLGLGFGYISILLLLVALLSGVYPAIYISSFKTVEIFKGKAKFNSKNRLTKVILGIQYVLAIVIVTLGVRFNESQQFFINKDWGYEKSDIVVIPIENSKQLNFFESKLTTNPQVSSFGVAENHIGRNYSEKNIAINGIDKTVRLCRFEGKYFNTMGYKLLEGISKNEIIESKGEK